MKAVFKYPLVIFGEQCVPIPMGGQFLSVQTQDDHPVVYFLIDTDELSQNPVVFKILGTGRKMEEGYLEGFSYIGTIQTGAYYMWHIWMDDSRIRKGR